MQQPNPPLPPLAPLWDRILRARTLPPDLDVQLLYVAIRDRLTHPEWEVRLHALRVLADLLPLSGNALSFPFDQVVDNLGHSSPNVRKAALDALKVFCMHCENPECAARAIADKCSYQNIRPESANIDAKVNVVTGLLLSLPSMITILKRRSPSLNVFSFFQILGEKLFDPLHKDVALRSLLKLRKACGPQAYMMLISRLDPNVQDKFRLLCETYDEDSLDVFYAQRKSDRHNNNNQQLVSANHVFSPVTTPVRISTDTSSEESFLQIPYYNNAYARVIIETEIKFDSDTAITMTVLEENETESDKNTLSEDDYDSADRNMLKFSDEESDTDVVVKKVRFGGESVKIRTPDSENVISSEDDSNKNKVVHVNNDVVPIKKQNVDVVSTTPKTTTIVRKVDEMKREVLDRPIKTKTIKKSGIPLPVIKSKPPGPNNVTNYSKVKRKSKSLSELYDYFRTKNGVVNVKAKKGSGFELTVAEVKSPEKVPSPVEPHREVEVLHNLQRSPVVSPQRRRRTQLYLEHDGFVVNFLTSSSSDQDLLSPTVLSPLRPHYSWEDFDIVPHHVVEQLHNTENWIAVVKAADLLHSTLLEENNVKKIEPAGSSLVQHMWALGDAVPAARAPAEGAVCALVRSCSNDCARRLLPLLVSRLARPPPPSSLPHALLHRLALHHLVDLIFDPTMIGVSGDEERMESAQIRATLCAARAAGPAAVLAAVRRRLTGTDKADDFCNKLRERLNRPTENIRPTHISRGSQLPVPVRRARSTPPPTAPRPPRRLRPLPDSAPLPGNSQPSRELLKHLSPIPLSKRDSSAFTTSCEDKETDKKTSLESNKKSDENFFVDRGEIEISAEEDNENPPPPPRSPSIHIEDYSEKSNPSLCSTETQRNASRVESRQGGVEFGSQKSLHLSGVNFGSQKSLQNIEYETQHSRPPSRKYSDVDFGSQKSLQNIEYETQHSRPHSRKYTPSPIRSKSRSDTSSPFKSPLKSGNPSPEPTSDAYEEEPACTERDVRRALAECIIPPRHEDWEVIVKALVECERLAVDPSARAPTSSWRTVARSAATHVRSLRSRVARTACCTLGSLFEHRGRSLDPELEEAATALLERSADVNRFLRADAANALVRMACGSNIARAAVALSRRGATHRAGPVRAAAAQALAKLVQYNGASKVLIMAAEPRTVFLRAAGELLGDATAEARLYGRHLCLALSEDARFQSLLKESMPPTRFRAIEKFVEKLKCR